MKKRTILLILLILPLLTGCFATLPTATVQAAKTLKKGMVMAEDDYKQLGDAMIDLVEDPTKENLEKLTEEKAKFDKVFKALKFAVDANCDAIIELGEEE